MEIVHECFHGAAAASCVKTKEVPLNLGQTKRGNFVPIFSVISHNLPPHEEVRKHMVGDDRKLRR